MSSNSQTHDCPARCGRQVDFGMYACRMDWFRLPPALRNAIWAGFRSGDAAAHASAMSDAQRWFDENPRPGPVPKTVVVKPDESRLF